MVVSINSIVGCQCEIKIDQRKFTGKRNHVENSVVENNNTAICFFYQSFLRYRNFFFSCFYISPTTKPRRFVKQKIARGFSIGYTKSYQRFFFMVKCNEPVDIQVG